MKLAVTLLASIAVMFAVAPTASATTSIGGPPTPESVEAAIIGVASLSERHNTAMHACLRDYPATVTAIAADYWTAVCFGPGVPRRTVLAVAHPMPNLNAHTAMASCLLFHKGTKSAVVVDHVTFVCFG